MTWLAAARRRNQRLGAIAYDTGTNTPRRLDLRNTGYLERVRLTQQVTFQYATAGPTGVDALGKWGGALSRVTLMANSVGLLFDCAGYMAAIISAIDDQYNDGSGAMSPAPNSFTTSPGTSATTDTWVYDLPVSINLANKATPIGFFQTALNSQETSIEVRWNPVAVAAGAPGTGVYTGNTANNTPGSNTGSLDLQQIYFDPIADPASQPTLAWIHQWKQWQSPLTADGETDIILPPSNYYTRLIYIIVTGGSGALALDSTHLTRLQLLYGANLAPYDEYPNAALYRMAHDYDFIDSPGWTTTNGGFGGMIPGVYTHDFLAPSHTERDILNSAATTNLRSAIWLTGATYSGGAYVLVAAEQLIPLLTPAPNTPAVQGVAA